MAIRTFLALDLAESVRRQIRDATGRFPAAEAKIRWVAPENLHVTVKFLGDVADADLARVCQAVEAVAARAEAMEFHVRGLRCVPPGGGVRMVWAEVDEPAGRMAALFGDLETALEKLGFPREGRQFHPHITLARLNSAKNPREIRAAAARHAETDFGATLAEEIVVYRSDLTPRGPIYTPTARCRLGCPG